MKRAEKNRADKTERLNSLLRLCGSVVGVFLFLCQPPIEGLRKVFGHSAEKQRQRKDYRPKKKLCVTFHQSGDKAVDRQRCQNQSHQPILPKELPKFLQDCCYHFHKESSANCRDNRTESKNCQ